MQFVIEGHQIKCVRITQNRSDGPRRSQVVASFDSQLDDPAPHVRARLRPAELHELQKWLNARALIRDSSVRDAVLQSIAPLLEEAARALGDGNGGTVDPTLRLRLGVAVTRFAQALDAARPQTDRGTTTTPALHDADALKERLAVIREKL